MIAFLNVLITLLVLAVIYCIGKKVIDAIPRLDIGIKDLISWVWLAICAMYAISILFSLLGVAGFPTLRVLGR